MLRPAVVRKAVRLAVTASVLGAFGACSFHARPLWVEIGDPTERPVVERIEDDALRIRWPVSQSFPGMTVYAGTAPDAIDRSRPVGRAVTLQNAVVVDDLDPFTRYYFELVPHGGGEPRIVAERRLPLEGTNNFRDLGGYDSHDGRTVRWGLLYRSNALDELTRADLEYLAGLRVNLVCDFRSEPERGRAPNRLPELDRPAVANLSISVLGVDPVEMQERIRTGRIEGHAVRETMRAAYAAFVTDFSEQYRGMLARISDRALLPTILHCTGGKDRAGFGSALVLLTLGVPEDDVFEDYLRTNAYRASYNRWIMRLVPLYSLFRTEGEDLAPLLEARREYLQASLDTIDARYGGFEGYLEQGLGVDAARRERIQEIFLRDPDRRPAQTAAIRTESRAGSVTP